MTKTLFICSKFVLNDDTPNNPSLKFVLDFTEVELRIQN